MRFCDKRDAGRSGCTEELSPVHSSLL